MTEQRWQGELVKSRVQLQQLQFAHQILLAVGSLQSTIGSARSLAGRDRREIDEKDWAALREHLLVIDMQVQDQLYAALSFMHAKMPRAAAGLVRPLFRRESPMQVLGEMLPLYVEVAKHRGLEIHEPHEDPSSPFPPIDLEVHAVRRVFHNVLANAVKYSYSGRAAHRYIEIWSKRHDAQGRWWKVSVQNYGVGIEEDELHRVLEPGYRGILARKENTFGTGLGLADARACMARHGGRIDIASRRVHGETYLTTVSLIFPSDTKVRRHYA